MTCLVSCASVWPSHVSALPNHVEYFRTLTCRSCHGDLNEYLISSAGERATRGVAASWRLRACCGQTTAWRQAILPHLTEMCTLELAAQPRDSTLAGWHWWELIVSVDPRITGLKAEKLVSSSRLCVSEAKKHYHRFRKGRKITHGGWDGSLQTFVHRSWCYSWNV